MTRVFISYATEDRPTAERLAASLTTLGWDVWWDRRLLPGSRFDEVIEAHLDEAHAVVVIWSANSVASEWVRAEATTAAERAAMIPVLIEPCRIPLRFRNIQAIDLSDWSGDSEDERIDRLREAVEAVTVFEEPDSAAPEPETTARLVPLDPAPTNVETARVRAHTGEGGSSTWSHWWRVATAVVVVLLVGAAGYAFFTSDRDSPTPVDDERAPAATSGDADTPAPNQDENEDEDEDGEADVAAPEDSTPVGRTDGLDSGEWLYAEDERHSADGHWLLRMQPDGNLVVEDEWNAADPPIWASNTSGVPGARAVMQPDGNFVILDYSTGENQGAIFSTGTSGNSGATLTIQNDGAVVVRSRTGAQLFNSLVDGPSV